MSVRMTSSLEFSGTPPPGNQRAGELGGGSVGLAKPLVSVTEGSVSLKAELRHARCFRAGVRDQQGRTTCGCWDLRRCFATGRTRVGRSRPGSSAIVAGIPSCSACPAGASWSRRRSPGGSTPSSTSSPRIAGRTVIVVDDGLATGATMRAALRSVRTQSPAHLVVAVPVGSREACEALRTEADEVVCLHAPASFNAVGSYYLKFDQTSDDEVRRLLQEFTPGGIQPYAR